MISKFSQHPLIVASMLLAGSVGAFGFALIPTPVPLDERYQRALNEIDRQSEELDATVARIEQATRNLSKSPSGEAIALRRQLAALQKRVDLLDARQTRLQNVLGANPTKALEVPMIRRDVRELQDGRVRDAAALQQSIDRIYDMNKWLLGGMALSVIALALAFFFQRGKP